MGVNFYFLMNCYFFGGIYCFVLIIATFIKSVYT